MLNVGIYLYDEVEVLDFAGPLEVFCTASRVWRRRNPEGEPPFTVFTVSQSRAAIRARGGLMVEPHLGFDDAPAVDILIVPGGVIDVELAKPEVIDWIAGRAGGARLTASVCTGAFLLGKAGLLSGRQVTTHWEDIADLRRALPDARVVEDRRWVDEGDIITSAGISAGIDMSLHIVRRIAGEELAAATARQMDYRWQDQAD